MAPYIQSRLRFDHTSPRCSYARAPREPATYCTVSVRNMSAERFRAKSPPGSKQQLRLQVRELYPRIASELWGNVPSHALVTACCVAADHLNESASCRDHRSRDLRSSRALSLLLGLPLTCLLAPLCVSLQVFRPSW